MRSLSRGLGVVVAFLVALVLASSAEAGLFCHKKNKVRTTQSFSSCGSKTSVTYTTKAIGFTVGCPCAPATTATPQAPACTTGTCPTPQVTAKQLPAPTK